MMLLLMITRTGRSAQAKGKVGMAGDAQFECLVLNVPIFSAANAHFRRSPPLKSSPSWSQTELKIESAGHASLTLPTSQCP